MKTLSKPARILLALLIAITLTVSGIIALHHGYLSAVETACTNNLKQIGLALSTYHDNHREFPPARAGGHSWRIRALPFMWSSPQFSEYDFDQPWNAENNITIDTRPLQSKTGEPRVFPNPYGPPCDGDDPHSTSYLLIVGQNAFADPHRPRQKSEISDGLENTIAAVEVAGSNVHWLSPVDLDFDKMSFSINSRPQSISSSHPSGPAVLFCDGAVYRVNPGISPAVVRGLCTINGGESISRDALIAEGMLVP